MKKLGLIVNPKKENIVAVAAQVVDWLEKKGRPVVLQQAAAQALGRPDLAREEEEFARSAQGVVALGGDGTVLYAAREMARFRIPVFGVNLGQLGFLTEVELPNLFPALEKLASGDYGVEERMMLEAAVIRHGQTVEQAPCLNDAVITKGALARLIKLAVHVDGNLVDTYPADGLITATPTGSTAYSLSAGGPITVPDIEVIIVTPICPHSLYARPIVLPGGSEIRAVLVDSQDEVMLTMDGQKGFALCEGDVIVIKRAASRARFIKLSGRSFFTILREKLTEGGACDV